jgi:hypothetical protein
VSNEPTERGGTAPARVGQGSDPFSRPTNHLRVVEDERAKLGGRGTGLPSRVQTQGTQRHFPDWIEEYINVLAPNSEAPEKFHFWVAVSTIAGVLRRRVCIDQGTFKWYPNFYIVLVGEPGIVKKGTAIKTGLRLLRDIPGVSIGSDVATWQGFLKQLEESIDSFAIGDGPLAFRKHVTTNALTIPITEWGTFINPEDPIMINMLTKLWDCEDGISLSKTTLTQGDITIINPFVNMLAATTPTWMRDNIRTQFGGWGLSSRIIFIFASRPARIVTFPDELQTAKLLAERLAPLSTDLLAISKLRGNFEITQDARAFAKQWNSSHVDRQINLASQPDHNPWLSYFLARKLDYSFKLAIVLAAARRSELVIDYPEITDAIARMDEVEGEMRNIFGERERMAPAAASAAARVNNAAWGPLHLALKANPRLPASVTQSFLARYMDFRSANDFMSQLVSMQYLTREQDIDGLWCTLGSKAEP